MITSKPGEMPLDIVHDPFLHFRALQCRHRMVIEDLSRVGHAQLARRPVEEAGAERRLQLLEAMAHRRFRHVEIAARRSQAAGIHDADEIAEVVQVEHGTPQRPCSG